MKIRILILSLLCLTDFELSAQGPVSYDLKVGEVFKVTATVKQNIDQTMLGQVMTTLQTITTVDTYEVVEVSNNRIKMKTTGLSRSLFTESNGGTVSMDSDLPGDDHLAFRVLTGKSYYVTMDQFGKFIRFDGLEDMAAEVRNELKGTILEGQTEQLLSAFTPEALGSAFDGQFHIYQTPGKPWRREADMVVNNLPISVTYDFSRSSESEIKATGDMTMEGEFEVMSQMMSAEMSGTQESIFTLDRDTGLSTKITTTQEMTGSLEVSGINVPMTLKTNVEVTIVK